MKTLRDLIAEAKRCLAPDSEEELDFGPRGRADADRSAKKPAAPAPKSCPMGSMRKTDGTCVSVRGVKRF